MTFGFMVSNVGGVGPYKLVKVKAETKVLAKEIVCKKHKELFVMRVRLN